MFFSSPPFAYSSVSGLRSERENKRRAGGTELFSLTAELSGTIIIWRMSKFRKGAVTHITTTVRNHNLIEDSALTTFGLGELLFICATFNEQGVVDEIAYAEPWGSREITIRNKMNSKSWKWRGSIFASDRIRVFVTEKGESGFRLALLRPEVMVVFMEQHEASGWTDYPECPLHGSDDAVRCAGYRVGRMLRYCTERGLKKNRLNTVYTDLNKLNPSIHNAQIPKAISVNRLLGLDTTEFVFMDVGFTTGLRIQEVCICDMKDGVGRFWTSETLPMGENADIDWLSSYRTQKESNMLFFVMQMSERAVLTRLRFPELRMLFLEPFPSPTDCSNSGGFTCPSHIDHAMSECAYYRLTCMVVFYKVMRDRAIGIVEGVLKRYSPPEGLPMGSDGPSSGRAWEKADPRFSGSEPYKCVADTIGCHSSTDFVAVPRSS